MYKQQMRYNTKRQDYIELYIRIYLIKERISCNDNDDELGIKELRADSSVK